jgi:hypothetical protein
LVSQVPTCAATARPHAGHRLYNSAKPASGAGAFNACYMNYTPKDPDLVLYEFGVNAEAYGEQQEQPEWKRLIDLAWRLESKPAVINVVGRCKLNQVYP